MSDAALNIETNRYLDSLFDGADAALAAEEERARDTLDDADVFAEIICDWLDYDTFNSLVHAIYNAVDLGKSPGVFCKSLHAEIIRSAVLKVRKEA